MKLLYNDINWDSMPFPKEWFEDTLRDKINEPRGYLKIEAFNEAKDHKKIYEFGGENQIMYWLKHSLSMLEGGVLFKDSGEHKGYEDGGSSQLDETSMPANWKYIVSQGEQLWSTHAWNSSSDSLATGDDLSSGTVLYPFFPTKMRFGEEGPSDITTPITPSEISLNDTNAQGGGNVAGRLNFILISRTQHIAFTTTGFNETNPTGYYDDYGSVFKNITVYQVTMPASAVNYAYDGKSLSEAGLYCDAALTGTKAGLYEQPYGMILAKRYFSPIQKTNTISINFQWSIIK
jgi:hypothetical protein